MDARNRFGAKSVPQSQREIVRKHKSFYRGARPETTPSDIPGGAEQEIYNFRNFGTYLESRSGSVEWGKDIGGESPIGGAELPGRVDYDFIMNSDGLFENIENSVGAGDTSDMLFYRYFLESTFGSSPAFVLNFGWVITYTYNSVEYTEDIQTADVSYIISPSQDLVRATTTLLTRLSDTIPEGTELTLTIKPPIVAAMFSQKYRVWFLDMGGSIYRSTDEYCTTYERIVFVGDIAGYNEPLSIELDPRIREVVSTQSTMIEIGNNVYHSCDSGLYIINLDESPTLPKMWKTNTATPSRKLADFGVDDETQPWLPLDTQLFGRKSLYTYSRLRTSNNRLADGNKVLWESGACLWSDDRDYNWSWADSEDDYYENVLISDLQDDKEGSVQATHFSIYTTKNIHPTTGIMELSNNPEEFIWQGDIPVAWMGIATVTGKDGGYIYVTLNEPLPNGLLKCPVQYGTSYKALLVKEDGLPSGTHYLFQEGDAVFTIGNEYYIHYGVESTLGDIDAITGNTIRSDNSDLRYNVGDMIWFENGSFSEIVNNYLDGTTQYIEVSKIPSGVLVGGKLSLGPGIIITGTVTSLFEETLALGFKLPVYDQQITDRSLLLNLPTRLMQPLPNGNLIAWQGKFLMLGASDETSITYCQVKESLEYTIGCHDQGSQYHLLDSTLQAIERFKDSVTLFCTRGTVGIATNVGADAENSDPDSGRYVLVPPSMRNISDTIGCRKQYHIARDSENTVYVLTTDCLVRRFDGLSYSDDITKGRIDDIIKSRIGYLGLTYIQGVGVVLTTEKVIGVE